MRLTRIGQFRGSFWKPAGFVTEAVAFQKFLVIDKAHEPGEAKPWFCSFGLGAKKALIPKLGALDHQP